MPGMDNFIYPNQHISCSEYHGFVLWFQSGNGLYQTSSYRARRPSLPLLYSLLFNPFTGEFMVTVSNINGLFFLFFLNKMYSKAGI